MLSFGIFKNSLSLLFLLFQSSFFILYKMVSLLVFKLQLLFSNIMLYSKTSSTILCILHSIMFSLLLTSFSLTILKSWALIPTYLIFSSTKLSTSKKVSQSTACILFLDIILHLDIFLQPVRIAASFNFGFLNISFVSPNKIDFPFRLEIYFYRTYKLHLYYE